MLNKQILTDYFRLTRRDRIGFAALLLLIGLSYAAPLFFPRQDQQVLQPLPHLQGWIDSVSRTAAANQSPDPPASYSRTEEKKARLFVFDPNLLDAKGWSDLGLPERNIRTLLNYRSKGGRFRQAEDLQKIWGLPPGFYERVKAFIRIASPPEQKRDWEDRAWRPVDAPSRPEPLAVGINTADSAAWEALPGIGGRLAQRILSFREKLGGFYSVEQVAETYGLPDSVFTRIRPRLRLDGNVQKINLNTVSKEALQAHPYFRWKLANVLINYRAQHGPLNDLDAFRRHPLLTDSLWNKIRPYLTLEE
jgi:competence protein ComEA